MNDEIGRFAKYVTAAAIAEIEILNQLHILEELDVRVDFAAAAGHVRAGHRPQSYRRRDVVFEAAHYRRPQSAKRDHCMPSRASFAMISGIRFGTAVELVFA